MDPNFLIPPRKQDALEQLSGRLHRGDPAAELEAMLLRPLVSNGHDGIDFMIHDDLMDQDDCDGW